MVPELQCSKCRGLVDPDSDWTDDGFSGVICKECQDEALQDFLDDEGDENGDHPSLW